MKTDMKFFGYTLQERNVMLLEFHKPGCEIVTMDGMLSPSHPRIDDPKLWDDADWEDSPITSKKMGTDIRFSLSRIKKIFDGLSDHEKQRYDIFGVAIEKSDIPKLFDDLSNYEEQKHDLFGDAIEKPDFSNYIDNCVMQKIKSQDELSDDEREFQKNMVFCGFDVMENEMSLSTLINCAILWTEAEESGKLNHHSLFVDYKSAADYAERCLELVAEHSPCVPWAIYRVDNPVVKKIRLGFADVIFKVLDAVKTGDFPARQSQLKEQVQKVWNEVNPKENNDIAEIYRVLLKWMKTSKHSSPANELIKFRLKVAAETFQLNKPITNPEIVKCAKPFNTKQACRRELFIKLIFTFILAIVITTFLMIVMHYFLY